MFEGRITARLPIYSSQGEPYILGQKNIADIAASAAAGAPYLKELLEGHPDILEALKSKSPETIFQGIIDNIEPAPFDALSKSLRIAKQKIHLLAALCDLAGVWDWAEVTENLSEFADACMQALITSIAKEMEFEPSARGPVPGLFIMALGKYGARELNYSSDIDLIVFYDPDHVKLPNPEQAERTLVRFVRKLMRGFDEITPNGYIFRTDLRLRPDPRSNSVAVSTLTAERYYETLGQNWERAAMIKARPVGGDIEAANDFIKNVLTPFIWRRSLDYAAIADIHSIKRQIQGSAKIEDLDAAGHDLKLGLGGIREIEFFAQVQQLILGGRNQQLRTPRTIDALDALAGGGYADKESIEQLKQDYAALRDLEHRTQMYADEQTHIWPMETEPRNQLASLCGADDLADFEIGLRERFGRVHKFYNDLFPGEEQLAAAKGSLVFTGVEMEAATRKTLEAYGIKRSSEVWHHMADWLGGRIRAARTPRARELLTRLAPRIIEACGSTSEPDTAFFNFADFIARLNAGITLFSLFLNKPDALTSIIDMLAIAPQLSGTLSAQPALIDAMVEPEFLQQKTSVALGQYETLLGGDTDFETALNSVRRAVHEDQFSLTASLLKLQNIENSGKLFSGIASAAIHALLPVTANSVGDLLGEYAVLGLGKLGSHEMTLSSDIDVMLIYETDAGRDDSGQFNKFTRRLITALSSVTQEGRLYEVDMALRPSGRSGPLAVSLAAFDKYYTEDAWTWEFMALTRARVVASSSAAFTEKLTKRIDAVMAQKDFAGKLAHDVLDMHKRLAKDKPAKGNWDIKGAPGGLRDIEFIAQYLALKHRPKQRPLDCHGILELAEQEKCISKEQANTLIKAARTYHTLLQMIALMVEGVFDPMQTPFSVKTLLAQSVGCGDFAALEKTYADHLAHVSKVFESVIAD